MKNFKLYEGDDLRELPSYGIAEAAHYLRIPLATLRSWVLGRYYPTEFGRQFFKPIITFSDKKHYLLSFMNLVEIHVLDAIRRDHSIPLQKVRTALEYLRSQFHSKYPLAHQTLDI